jgi:hypothetical protein
MSKVKLAMAFLAVALMLSSIGLGAESDWPCWRGPNRDGKSPDTNLLKKWPEGGPSWAHPVVIGGRLYLRYADNLYCFDVKAG